VFAQQIAKAVEVGKPLVVHSRKAEDDTIALLKKNMPREWHVHVRALACSMMLHLNRLFVVYARISVNTVVSGLLHSRPYFNAQIHCFTDTPRQAQRYVCRVVGHVACYVSSRSRHASHHSAAS
jgi:Tat protein secretion system quality control protein TatD with DNase activity